MRAPGFSLANVASTTAFKPVMTTTSTVRSSSSSRHKPRSRSHSSSHSARSSSHSTHARSHSGGRSRPKKNTRSRSRSGGRVVAFRCMRCKVSSPSTVEEYVTEKYGNRQTTMAKGFCRKCDGKMSLIVPASSQTHKSSSISRSHSGSRPKRSSKSHSATGASSKSHNKSRRSSRSHSPK